MLEIQNFPGCSHDSLSLASLKPLCGEMNDFVYRSTDNVVNMTFVADGSVNGKGFYISFSFLDVRGYGVD